VLKGSSVSVSDEFWRLFGCAFPLPGPDPIITVPRNSGIPSGSGQPSATLRKTAKNNPAEWHKA
jgi:hypothetical protein